MNEEKINLQIKELESFISENEKLFLTLKEKFSKVEQEIFSETCHKKHLNKCEPEYCAFRIENTCKYFDMLAPLLTIKKNIELKI